MKKKLIITIDTEGDNQWQWRPGSEITTKNAYYIPRFQELCDKFQFIPTYLTNYEMLQDKYFVDFTKHAADQNRCEIGMHLHAWNTPPYYDLVYQQNYGAPYLVEYPKAIMKEKIKVLTLELENAYERKILSHRAGRWATNNDYFDLLMEYGYKYDCSVTPHMDWSTTAGATVGSKGSNYKNEPEKPYKISNFDRSNTISELPVTIKKIHGFMRSNKMTIKGMLKTAYRLISGRTIWMRPTTDNIYDLLYLIDLVKKSDDPYLMFMLHSSELMPGGSPYFKNAADIEDLYEILETIFSYMQADFSGIKLNAFSC